MSENYQHGNVARVASFIGAVVILIGIAGILTTLAN